MQGMGFLTAGPLSLLGGAQGFVSLFIFLPGISLNSLGPHWEIWGSFLEEVMLNLISVFLFPFLGRCPHAPLAWFSPTPPSWQDIPNSAVLFGVLWGCFLGWKAPH